MSVSAETEHRAGQGAEAKVKKTGQHATPESTFPENVRSPGAAPPAAKGHRLLFWLIAIVVFGSAAYLTTTRIMDLRAANQAKAPPPRVIPVMTGRVERRNLNLHLSGLGTVTAYNTVTLRSRVDGELINVAFSEGQMVEKDQLLVEIDPRPYQVQLDQALGQLAKDQAALKNSQLDLARSTALVQSKTVTQQQVDTEAALVQQNEGIVKSDQAMVDMAKLQLSYCRVTSPIAGRIGLRTIDEGNMIHASDVQGLAVITQLQPISVVFTIPQDEIARVQQSLATDKKLVVEAFDRGFQNLLATGTLEALDNQVNATTGTLKLKAVFANENNLLFPNQFVNARLTIETLADAVVGPTAAVQRGPQSTFVYVVKPDDTVEIRNVALGANEGDVTVFASGLQPGEQVVVDGVDKLQPGAKVSISKPNGAKKPDAQAGAGAETKSHASSSETTPARAAAATP